MAVPQAGKISAQQAGTAPARIDSMDQFRGYTMAGMFLVNFIGAFAAVHPLLKHHNTYHSYADTIMPHFFFAVGFSLRLVILRNIAQKGEAQAYRKAVIRSLMLVLVGLVIYHLDGHYETWEQLTAIGWTGFLATSFWRTPFQALVHIGITSLWVLPVIARTASTRIAWMLGSAAVHLALSHAFWYELLREKRVIDGGPLGFLTWAIPTLAGSLAYDLIRERGARGAIYPLVRWGAGLAIFGYALSCLNAVFNPVKPGGIANWLVEPPFWAPSRPVDLWTMSQQAGANSYLWFSTGFSLLAYAAFVWWTDQNGKQWGLFRVFGLNPLAGYVLHGLIADAVRPFAPQDAPLRWIALMFFAYFGVLWLFLWGLDRQRIYIRL
jgi:predicted acyltransferase